MNNVIKLFSNCECSGSCIADAGASVLLALTAASAGAIESAPWRGEMAQEGVRWRKDGEENQRTSER